MVTIFKDKLIKSSKTNESKIIIALDNSVELKKADRSSWNIKKKLLTKETINIIEKLGDKIAGVKINRQLVLSLGLYDYLPEVIDSINKFGLPLIADCKINDVGHTNEWITKHYLNAGFDAVIANPFIGWEMGIDQIFKIAKDFNAGVILLVYMSHPGAVEGYGQTIIDSINGSSKPQYMQFAQKANQWKADGIIIGATAPEKILEVSKILNKDILIISPGVGVQGGDLERAFSSGTSYIIVGRSIINSDKPEELVLGLNSKIKKLIYNE